MVAKLNTFFTQLNAGRKQPYDWAGDEPSLGIPWEYDYAGAPWRTQGVVRRIVTTLYGPTPNGEPGNDDLGAMSSWYVWAAMGLYPETPGRGELVLGSPLFPHITMTLGKRAHHRHRRTGRLARHSLRPEPRGRGARPRAPCGCPASPGTGPTPAPYTLPVVAGDGLATPGPELTFTLGASPDAGLGRGRRPTRPPVVPPASAVRRRAGVVYTMHQWWQRGGNRRRPSVGGDPPRRRDLRKCHDTLPRPQGPSEMTEVHGHAAPARDRALRGHR